MIRLAETRGKLIAVCRGTEPNANGPDNPICEPPSSCTDARTIVPTASPTTVDSCCVDVLPVLKHRDSNTYRVEVLHVMVEAFFPR